jgi:hypothetical protein
MLSTLSFTVSPLRAAFLQQVRRSGRDDQQQPIVRQTAEGGEPLRDLLRRARPGEEIILASYCPFTQSGPFREFGPIYVSTAGGAPEPQFLFDRRLDSADDYFRDQLTLRAYNRAGAIAAAAIVAFAVAPAQVETFLAEAEIDFVDARFPIYGCFAARFVRAGTSSANY